jgi:hypothetical protein
MTTARVIDGVGLKYMRDVAKYYIFSIIFFFDFLNFIMIVFKLIFPETLIVILIEYFISILSLPVISKNF